MATLSRPRPRVKPSRRATLSVPMSTGERLLTLTEGEGEKAKFTSYYLSSIPSDFGAAFRLEKFSIDGGETYCVNLAPNGNSCECKGHLRHGHRTVCRHVASLVALRSAGRI